MRTIALTICAIVVAIGMNKVASALPQENAPPIQGESKSRGQFSRLASNRDGRVIQPNVVIEIPSQVVESLGTGSIDDSFEVDDVIRGSIVQGQGQFDAKRSLEFIPADGRVALKLIVAGNANSQSVGRQDQVQVRTRGELNFSSATAIVFNEDGLSIKPFATNVRLTTSVESITTPFKTRRRNRLAYQDVYGRQELDRQEAARHAIRDLNSTFDGQLLESIGGLRDQLQTDLIDPLQQNDSVPVTVAMKTFEDRAEVQLQIGEPQELSQPDVSQAGDSIRVLVHQTAANEWANEYSGETMSLEEAIGTFLPATDSVSEVQNGQVMVTLSDENPIGVRFGEQAIELIVRGKQYEHAGQKYGAMEIVIGFRMESTPGAESVLVAETPEVRAGVDPDGKPLRMGVRGYSLRRILNNALERDVPKRIELSHFELPESIQSLGSITTNGLQFRNGWAEWLFEFEAN